MLVVSALKINAPKWVALQYFAFKDFAKVTGLLYRRSQHQFLKRQSQSVIIGVKIGDHVLEGDLGTVCFS